MFDIPQMFLVGGPDNATMTTNVFIYKLAFSGGYLYNRAGAASMIMFVIIVAVSLVMFYFFRDKDEVKQKKIEKQVRREARRKAKEAMR